MSFSLKTFSFNPNYKWFRAFFTPMKHCFFVPSLLDRVPPDLKLNNKWEGKPDYLPPRLIFLGWCLPLCQRPLCIRCNGSYILQGCITFIEPVRHTLKMVKMHTVQYFRRGKTGKLLKFLKDWSCRLHPKCHWQAQNASYKTESRCTQLTTHSISRKKFHLKVVFYGENMMKR